MNRVDQRVRPLDTLRSSGQSVLVCRGGARSVVPGAPVAAPRAAPGHDGACPSRRVLWCGVLTVLVLWVDVTCVASHRNSFLPDPARLLYYAAFFVVGVEWYTSRDLLARLARLWPAYLIASLPLFAGAEALLRAYGEGPLPTGGRALLAVSWSLFAWLSVFGFVGLAQRLLAWPNTRVRQLADASYWIYLVHFPLVAALQILLVDVPVPAVGKFVLVVVVALALCLWTYERWVPDSAIGVLLNGSRSTRTNHGVLSAPAS